MSKASILVVDDEPAVLKVLVTRLQLAGYEVFSATNGEEAIEAFHKESPDLIVLDVMLPKMDGFAVCRRIRAESVVPIIFLTALEAISERVAGLDLGAEFVSLYDHPDKYLSPDNGGNPFCKGGAEDTRVYLTESCHWKVTNSTTMTFAAEIKTLKENEEILRKHTSGTHPNDFQMFLELRKNYKLLITPIPGYATHGETAWLSPLTDWSKI